MCCFSYCDNERFSYNVFMAGGGVALLYPSCCMCFFSCCDNGCFSCNVFTTGGGVALLYASRELEKLPADNFDQKVGVQIIQNALKVWRATSMALPRFHFPSRPSSPQRATFLLLLILATRWQTPALSIANNA